MKFKASAKVKSIFTNALEEVKNYDDTKLNPTHLLISIIIDGNNDVINILNKCKIDINKLFNSGTLFLGTNNLTSKRPYTTNTHLSATDTVNRFMKQINIECELLGNKKINELHLMLSILKSNSYAKKLLNKFNINYLNFKNNIMEKEFEEEMDRVNSENNQKPAKSNKNMKTPILDKFCNNISKAVEDGKIDPIIGRDKEIKRLSSILSRRKKNNPVLIGLPGVGKCVCSDTEVIIRNDLTGKIRKTTIKEVLKMFPNT